MEVYATLKKHLIKLDREPKLKDYEFSEESHSFGRRTKKKCPNFHTINLPYISSTHCTFQKEETEDGNDDISVSLKDLSSNGTFLNSVKIGKGNIRMLKDGDIVTFYMGKKGNMSSSSEGEEESNPDADENVVDQISFIFELVKQVDLNNSSFSNASHHQVEALTSQLSSLREEKGEVEGEVVESKRRVRELEKEVSDLRNELSMKEDEKVDLSSKREEMERQLQEKENERQDLITKIEGIEKERGEEMSKMKEDLCEKENEKESIQSELTSCQQLVTTLEESNQSLTSTQSQLNKEKEEISMELEGIREEMGSTIGNLEKELKDKNEEMEGLKKDFILIEQSNSQLVTKNTKLDTKNQELNCELEGVREKLVEYERWMEENSSKQSSQISHLQTFVQDWIEKTKLELLQNIPEPLSECEKCGKIENMMELNESGDEEEEEEEILDLTQQTPSSANKKRGFPDSSSTSSSLQIIQEEEEEEGDEDGIVGGSSSDSLVGDESTFIGEKTVVVEESESQNEAENESVQKKQRIRYHQREDVLDPPSKTGSSHGLVLGGDTFNLSQVNTSELSTSSSSSNNQDESKDVELL